jgi:hypothetical protein
MNMHCAERTWLCVAFEECRIRGVLLVLPMRGYSLRRMQDTRFVFWQDNPERSQ